MKLSQLRRAIGTMDSVALRQRLESSSALNKPPDEFIRGQGPSSLTQALTKLQRALRSRDCQVLANAIEEAAAAGVQEEELENAAQALFDLEEPMWRYDPDESNALDIRITPMITGPRASKVLLPGEVFRVSQEHRGADGILYLKLSDGRGWVFESKDGVGKLCARYEACRFTVITTVEGLPLDCSFVQLSQPPGNRIAVKSVGPGGWADRQGVRVGDEILAVAAQRVSTVTVGELYKVAEGKGPRPLALTFACKQDTPGMYLIIHDGSAVTPTFELGSDRDVITTLPSGTTVEVTEVVNNAKEQRIRGRISQPARGWISLLNTENGKRWARKQIQTYHSGGNY
eukprot:TRINITY_DN81493_c0_g1_i1.p1 TRINITY_DN81493_c0_g1~~TRINITY_DN81493_c0_g1_i1.p1  ORF type:complete len:344 (-),score=64.74 TRINITY_DN81493_c0_g1_i1:100-1131(-)